MAFANVQSFLYIRSEPTTDSEWVGKLYPDYAAKITGPMGEWTKVESGNVTGYVYSRYITVGNEAQKKAEELVQNNDTGNAEDAFTYAESREEEAARLQKEQEEQKAQAAGNGQAIVDYACQFIGNPYVWGGTSLTNGADCSGFVQSGLDVYKRQVLDFSRKEVVDHIFDQICKVLDQGNIEYVKWDMNRSLMDVFSRGTEDQGRVMYDYVLGLYDFLERIVTRYPDLLIEGCSGGGGRFDAGMMYYTCLLYTSYHIVKDIMVSGSRSKRMGRFTLFPAILIKSDINKIFIWENGK